MFLLYFGKGILRTLAYLEKDACSKPWYIQNTIKHIQFFKSSYLVLFPTSALKNIFLKNPPLKIFLIFWEMELSSLIFQEVIFQAQKIKKVPLWKNVWYFTKWNFLAPSWKNYLYFKRNCKSWKTNDDLWFSLDTERFK